MRFRPFITRGKSFSEYVHEMRSVARQLVLFLFFFYFYLFISRQLVLGFILVLSENHNSNYFNYGFGFVKLLITMITEKIFIVDT